VLRRASGGGTVLQSPGCLNFALILKIAGHPALKSITRTNTFVLERHEAALRPLLGPEVKARGTSDLTLGDLKFSGNAQRRKRHFILFHGTFLLDFDISLMEDILLHPPAEPDYRKNRVHGDFVTNVKTSANALKVALKKTWNADGKLEDIPKDKIEELVREKYSTDEWNLKF
jgi:lipoate-protein ligase A